MTRALQGLAAGLVAVVIFGCGGSGSSDATYALIRVSQAPGSQLVGIRKIDLRFTLGTRMATVPIERSSDIPLPTTKTIDVASGAGTLGVDAVAYDQGGAVLAMAHGEGTIVRGTITDIDVVFPAPAPDGGVPDGSLPDAGGDGQVGDGAVDAAPGSPAALAVTPAQQDFGSLVPGAMVTRSLTISNVGGSPTGSIFVSVDDPSGAFMLTDASACIGAPLDAGRSCMVTVAFMPGSPGSKSGTLEVSSSPGGAASAQLAGIGLSPASLDASPAALDFGSVVQGTSSGAQTQISNTGAVASGTLATAVSGSDADQFALTGCSGQTLAASGQCTLAVTFQPTSTGSKSATLTVTGAAGELTTVALTGTATSPAALTMTPSPVPFGSSPIGQAVTQVIAVTNSGGVASGTLTASLTGSNASEFAITLDVCTGQSLAPGATCRVTVRFRPTGAGARLASLTITVAGGSAVAPFQASGLGNLTVTVAGPGSVTSTPVGISCPGGCSAGFSSATVLLTATPDPGMGFASWSGGCTGSAPTCLVTVGAATAVTATFSPPAIVVTRSGTGTGTVSAPGGTPAPLSCGATCTAQYAAGTMVTLTAVPDATSTFLGWSGACTGVSTTCTVTVDGVLQVGAAFTRKPRIIVTFSGGGSGSVTVAPGQTCVASCTVYVDLGSNVTVSGGAPAGSTFTGFSGACAGVGACALHVLGDLAITATFTPASYPLTVVRSGSGTGTVTSSVGGINCGATCVATIAYNQVVTLTATPALGSVFAGWSGGCGGLSTCAVTVRGALTVTATFTTASYPVNVNPNGPGTVTSSPAGIACPPTCSANFPAQTALVLTATPQAGNLLAGWSGDCTTANHVCTRSPLLAPVNTTASFVTQNGNLVFASSDFVANNLGGHAAYDAHCNQLASNAGLGGSYIAWVSDNNNAVTPGPAGARLGGARGWVRIDGRPVTDQVSDLLTLNKIWNPIRLDEHGADVQSGQVLTGTTPNGGPDVNNCTTWTGNGGYAYGYADSGPFDWVSIGAQACVGAPASRIYCFEKDRMQAVAPVRPTGKLLFLSRATFRPGTSVGGNTGLAAVDQLCMNERPGGNLSPFRALLGTTSRPASALVVPGTTYLGLDGQIIATGAELMGVNAWLDSGVWEHADGSFPNNLVQVWSGAPGLTSLGTAASTCNDWLLTTSTTGRAGLAGTSNANVWFDRADQACTTASPVFCVEQ